MPKPAKRSGPAGRRPKPRVSAKQTESGAACGACWGQAPRPGLPGLRGAVPPRSGPMLEKLHKSWPSRGGRLETGGVADAADSRSGWNSRDPAGRGGHEAAGPPDVAGRGCGGGPAARGEPPRGAKPRQAGWRWGNGGLYIRVTRLWGGEVVRPCRTAVSHHAI